MLQAGSFSLLLSFGGTKERSNYNNMSWMFLIIPPFTPESIIITNLNGTENYQSRSNIKVQSTALKVY